MLCISRGNSFGYAQDDPSILRFYSEQAPLRLPLPFDYTQGKLTPLRIKGD